MPFLDAKALEIDPDGMAFLRSVIRPNFEREEAALPVLRKETRPSETASQGQAETPKPRITSEAATVSAG